MHIPMESLSQPTTKTDSGSGVRQSSGSGVSNNELQFGQIFSDELHKQSLSEQISKPDNADGRRQEGLDNQGERECPDYSKDEELAAGVMGNQNFEVVFILEGDSKSEQEQVIKTQIEAELPILDTETQKTAQMAGLIDETKPSDAVKAENATADFAHAMEKVADEAMARKPERTQERREGQEQGTKSSENGNPSPLENENETTQIKGQEQKFTQAAAAAGNAIESTAETASVVNAIEKTAEAMETTVNDVIPQEMALPLSEGITPERFVASEQIKSEAMYSPVKPENLFEEMISRVQTMQTDSISKMTIQLSPEFLGKVALEVAIDAAGLHVKISAEDSGVRSMLNGQITALIESLEDNGIEVSEVEVAHNNVNYDAFKDPHEGQSKQNKQHRHNREIDSKDGVAIYTALPDLLDYYLDSGVSSVQYSA